jgi:hypothetical protein
MSRASSSSIDSETSHTSNSSSMNTPHDTIDKIPDELYPTSTIRYNCTYLNITPKDALINFIKMPWNLTVIMMMFEMSFSFF